MGTEANGQATDHHAIPAVYGTPEQMAQLYASIAQITDREPDSTFEDVQVREVALHLVTTITNRMAGTYLPRHQQGATP